MPSNELWQTLWGAAQLVFVYMMVWFVIALAVRRNDVVDVGWGLGFIAIAVWLLIRAEEPSARQYAVSALVALWGLRLSWHIARRNLRPGAREDRRYAEWRTAWGKWLIPRSFLQIFMLQGVFMVFVAAPLLVVGSTGGPTFGLLDCLGVGVWVFGFLFESVGDAQLTAFLARPENRGHVMTGGLWAYTRHPNYFGEAVMWWGLAISALSIPGGWVGFMGPITITWLLTKVSGIPLAEARFVANPEWDAYKARTSAFLPLPPKRR